MAHTDLELLLMERGQMLRDLAPILKRVGPSHPKRERNRMNRIRTVERRKLRKALRLNAEAIAAYCMAHQEVAE